MGNLASGKSALVHRYLTGTYVQEESPEGKGGATHRLFLIPLESFQKAEARITSGLNVV